MEQTKQRREPAHRVPVGRIAAAAFAIGGVSSSVLAVSTAGVSANHATKSVVVSAVKNAKFGTILVSGKTLYTLKPGKTVCGPNCLKIWPELLLPKGVTKATAGTGVSAAKLGTVMRSGGALQVTYVGKALYWFSGDTAVGQVRGNITDLWGTWTDDATVKPSGGTNTTNPGTGGTAF